MKKATYTIIISLYNLFKIQLQYQPLPLSLFQYGYGIQLYKENVQYWAHLKSIACKQVEEYLQN